DNDKETFMVISPRELEVETDRILRSVDFSEVRPMKEYFDYPDKMMKKMDDDKRSLEKKLKELTLVSDEYLKKYKDEIIKSYSRIVMEEKVEVVKEKIAATKNFIYMSVWVPEDKKESIENYFNKYGDSTILTFRDIGSLNSSVIIPTNLKNNFIFNPFEELVEMYGIPSYDEIDPTAFFAISYMLLFGAMFGDLGQGLLILLAGMFIQRKKKIKFAGILTRLGLSSMLFGIIYDSFFGYEHVISKFFPNLKYIRPIENINTVLMISIFVGIVLLTISLILSIVNKLKRKDIQEGVFGRNGVVGLVLFLALIFVAIGILMDTVLLPKWLLIGLILISVFLIIVREPISNLILGTRPLYHSSKGEYYVESGFDIFETFLSILSNSVSFIRVGAFALNHVGLFMAFHTMAHIIGNVAGDLSMFIVGNLMIIFLEGLIVFIQGLRLVYYEMFSKYYEGEGILFEPDQILGGN
ncbi:MAG: V-type ATP synthase subunit I, partial [Clostridiales bacterium]|nr:V-type ATP synthase subunit I [Clostridiales bacterium]